MASEKTLPKITTKNWWGIRKKLKSTMPRNVSKTFVAAALSIKEVSAQMNVIAPMKQLGLLDENGTPTSLANEWRNDATYASACKKMREASYPSELLDLASDTDAEKNMVQTWIASHLMVGEESARQAASVYMLLLEADPEKQAEAAAAKPTGASATRPKKSAKPAPKKKQSSGDSEDSQEEQKKVKTSIDSSMNINIQIHISSDTNADQIDKIFSSMAKHLKSLN